MYSINRFNNTGSTEHAEFYVFNGETLKARATLA